MDKARIRFERKQVNRILVRCKNTKHVPSKKKAERRDLKKLES